MSHRLNNIKQRGNPTATAQSTPTKTTSAKSTPRKTPTSGRAKKTKHVSDGDGDGDGPMDDDDWKIKSPSVGRKRARSVKKEEGEEDGGLGKKVKQEIVEDEEDFSGIIGGSGVNGYADEEVEDDECV